MMNSNIIFKYHTIDKRLTNLEKKCDDIDKKCDMILEVADNSQLNDFSCILLYFNVLEIS